ncbi:coiled-coil and C2 domain-containing protein [Acrasis kona]|uniref:Coiled-coil and C2 domain-containing protein n=1 Tax=Acrasis kona TaxID=1008807 RepID=A0AAW2ZP88_9EUKA
MSDLIERLSPSKRRKNRGLPTFEDDEEEQMLIDTSFNQFNETETTTVEQTQTSYRSKRRKRSNRNSRLEVINEQTIEDEGDAVIQVEQDIEEEPYNEDVQYKLEDEEDEPAPTNLQTKQSSVKIKIPTKTELPLNRCVPKKPDAKEVHIKQTMLLTEISNQAPAIDGLISKLESKKESLQKLQPQLITSKQDVAAEMCVQSCAKLTEQITFLKEEYKKMYRDRDLKAEGLYVPEEPHLLKNKTHIIEQRYLRQPNSLERFFDEDGHLPQYLDPVKITPTKVEEDYLDVNLQTDPRELLKKTETLPHEVTTSYTNRMYRLEIEIKDISFNEHEIMSEEEYHCKQLVEMYNQYQELTRPDSLYHYYKKRTISLTSEMKKIRNTLQSDSDNQNMVHLRLEMKKFRSLLESEEHKQLRLITNIVEKWKLVKEIRSKNQIVTCNVRFQFDKIHHDLAQEQQERDDRIRQEMLERYEEGSTQQESTLYQSILDRINESCRQPGQPEIKPILSKIEITKETNLNQKEIQRIQSIKNHEYYIKLFMNGMFVSKTLSQSLRNTDNNYFVVKFSEVIPCAISKWPDSLWMEIWQKQGLMDTKLATTFIGIPDSINDSKSHFQQLRFSCNHQKPFIPLWDPNHPDNQTGWFSKWFHKPNPSLYKLNNGCICIQLNWIGDVPSQPSTNNRTAVDSHQDLIKNMNFRFDHHSHDLIDPNDPRNTGLLSLLTRLKNQIPPNHHSFHLAQQDEHLFFPNDQFSENHFRLHLLKLRFETKNKVPLQIPFEPSIEMVKNYESNILKCLHDDHHASQYVRKIRDHFKNQDGDSSSNQLPQKSFRLVRNNIKVTQYVSEPPMPQLSNGDSWFTLFFEPKRPLRPVRINREQSMIKNYELIKKCNLVIQIVRGFHVPIRANDENEAYRTYRSHRLKQVEEINQFRRTGKEPTIDHDDVNEDDHDYIKQSTVDADNNQQETTNHY